MLRLDSNRRSSLLGQNQHHHLHTARRQSSTPISSSSSSYTESFYPAAIPSPSSSSLINNNSINNNIIDPVSPTTAHLTYFDKHFHIISKLGSGSFADVFKVVSKKPLMKISTARGGGGGENYVVLDTSNQFSLLSTTSPPLSSLSSTSSSSTTSSSNLYYAVKRARSRFSGYRDRAAKLVEVEIMWTATTAIIDTLEEKKEEVEDVKILKRMGGRKMTHVVELVQAWEEDGFSYLCMELCSDGT